MDQATLEVLHAGQVGHVGRRQQAQAGHEEPRPVGDAAVGAHGPDAGVLVEFGLGHAGLEQDVLAQVVAVNHAVEVGEDLGLGDELRRPRCLRVEVAVEGVLVDEALRVRQCPGVFVPVPGAADSAGLVDRDGVESLLVAQLVQHVDAAEPGSDDEGVEVADLVRGRWTPWRVLLGCGRMFEVLAATCGVVH